MLSYFLVLRALHADTRKAQARLQEIQSGQTLAASQLLHEQTLRAEAAEAKVKILQAQLELTRRSRRHRRNRLRLREAQHRRLCCTNCAKSL